MTDQTDPVVIVSYARTPMGGFQGALSTVKATELGAVAVKAALERAGLAGDKVEQIVMGCVLPAGLGQAPARQAALGAGLAVRRGPAARPSTRCAARACSAAMYRARHALKAGSADVIVAGGMESMTNAPYLHGRKRRGGMRMGHGVRCSTSMYLRRPRRRVRERSSLMGTFAEECAASTTTSRAQAHGRRSRSVSLNQAPRRANDRRFAFAWEIVPVTGQAAARATLDDRTRRAAQFKAEAGKNPDAQARLQPRTGTVTAANSSSISATARPRS